MGVISESLENCRTVDNATNNSLSKPFNPHSLYPMTAAGVWHRLLVITPEWYS